MLALISAGTGADASADDDTSALAEADTSFNVDAGTTNDSVGANVGSTASAHASDFDVGVETMWWRNNFGCTQATQIYPSMDINSYRKKISESLHLLCVQVRTNLL